MLRRRLFAGGGMLRLVPAATHVPIVYPAAPTPAAKLHAAEALRLLEGFGSRAAWLV